MSEDTLVSYVREGVKPFAEFAKHNDSCTVGVPDVSLYIRRRDRNVWLELKSKDDWPARASTKIWWDHYTEQQALWLRTRNGWLLMRIGKQYILLDARMSWLMWEARGWTREELIARAKCVWNLRIPFDDFICEIQS